jgi:hypothetical protein
VAGLMPAGTYVKGSSITLNWTDDTNIPDVGDPAEGTFFDDGTGLKTFFFNPTASTVRVDQSFLNNSGIGGVGNPLGGLPYVGTFFSKQFQANTNGASTLSISSIMMRTPDNSPLIPDIVPAGGGHLIADGAPPVVSGVLIDNQTIDNDDYVKNGDQLVVTATVTDANPMSASLIAANLNGLYGGSGHAADGAATYVGTTATMPTVSTASCNPADDDVTVTVTATDLAGNTASASDVIHADNTPPSMLTNVTAHPLNGKIRLNWTNGTDDHLRGVALRYNRWNDYPKYDVTAPSYPADKTEGTAGAAFDGVVTGDWTIAPRDIYYISAFATDLAGNYSVVDAGGQDRATNYYLADMGSGSGLHIPGATGYDGRVNFDDLIWFSNVYAKSESQWTFGTDAEADFAPTLANKTYGARNRFAIPRPDNIINFDDLMIFSMNFMNTTPKIVAPQNPQLARELAIELMNSRTSTSQGELLTTIVRLANDGREVKGISAELSFNPSELQFIDANAGGLFGSAEQGFFYGNGDNGKVRIDAAVLGIDRTVNFSGNLAVVRFHATQSGRGNVTIAEAIVRGETNNEHPATLNNNAVEVPTVFSLAQNYPNPFNPSTRIDYQVPAPSRVTIEIFNLLGEKVATLVNEVKDAGYYTLVWDGRTDANIQVASGMYIYSMKADKFSNVKKMVLVK